MIRRKNTKFHNVTESRLILLTAQQANKLRDEFLEARNNNFIQKAVDGEGSGLVSQRTFLLKSEFRHLSH